VGPALGILDAEEAVRGHWEFRVRSRERHLDCVLYPFTLAPGKETQLRGRAQTAVRIARTRAMRRVCATYRLPTSLFWALRSVLVRFLDVLGRSKHHLHDVSARVRCDQMPRQPRI
jgi:hypothetical protein